jgi:hypothetical protein
LSSTFSLFTKSDVGQVISFSSAFTALVLATALFLSTVFALWGLPSVLGYYAGKNAAEQAIDLYTEKGCHFEQNKRWSNCKTLQSRDGKVIYEGILIANSDTRIAFFTQAGAIIAEVPRGASIINKANIIINDSD